MPDFGRDTLEFTGTGNATVAALGDPYELPYGADVVGVQITAGTAPTGADLVVDVLANGTSIFATALGTVGSNPTAQGATGGMQAGDVSFLYSVLNNDAPNLKVGQVLLIGTEKLVVTSVAASPLSGAGSVPNFTVGVTRAYDGTTAAAHTANTSVFPAKPFIPAGSTTSAGPGEVGEVLKQMSVPPIAAGTVFTCNITQVGSTVAGANVQVIVEVNQR